MDIEYEEIKQIELDGNSPVTNPRIVYITGQTGAGKTTLIKRLLQKQEYQNYVIIDSDMWRPFVPNYRECVLKTGTDETEEITGCTKRWRDKLFEECIENQYNIIYHTSMTNIEGVILQTNRLNETSYDISLAVLACNMLESRLSNCIRYINSVLRKRFWKIFI